jgi:chaperonin GroES
MLEMQPLGTRILIERIDEVVDGGLIIAESAKEKSYYGKVVAVNPSHLAAFNSSFIDLPPIRLQVGDMVLFSKYAGSEVNLNGKDYLIVQEDDIHGILKTVG